MPDYPTMAAGARGAARGWLAKARAALASGDGAGAARYLALCRMNRDNALRYTRLAQCAGEQAA